MTNLILSNNMRDAQVAAKKEREEKQKEGLSAEIEKMIQKIKKQLEHKMAGGEAEVRIDPIPEQICKFVKAALEGRDIRIDERSGGQIYARALAVPAEFQDIYEVDAAIQGINKKFLEDGGRMIRYPHTSLKATTKVTVGLALECAGYFYINQGTEWEITYN